MSFKAKIKQDIKKGGIVCAPRRSGKSSAILSLLFESDEYALVCHDRTYLKPYRDTLVKMGLPLSVAQQRVISVGSDKPEGKKLIAEETLQKFEQYHCVVLTLQKDLIVFDTKGKRIKFKKEQVCRK